MEMAPEVAALTEEGLEEELEYMTKQGEYTVVYGTEQQQPYQTPKLRDRRRKGLLYYRLYYTKLRDRPRKGLLAVGSVCLMGEGERGGWGTGLW